MNYGMFMMPSHPPERELYTAHQWDLDCLQLGDELGFSEAWIGEHFTSPWEPIPAPDLMIAQALMRTKNIKLCTGVHLLPYHHPAELACRVAYLDHMAQGRFMFGIGSSGLPTDYRLVPDEAVTPEYMAEHVWLVGSPDTVEKRLLSLYEMCGGFGTLLTLIYDNIENQQNWEKSMNLFANEVMPRFAELNPD
ncbi:2,5-diketocamphane 1,2-monooxygenase 2 [Geodia barretti]|uniref:2,5-diketocamphane 1,2-monooxygenase 2 n=1 Tax=Geodia barretti TaxID=519541 RepID=A0AA35TEL0_GEOBA|nr:2,5-diketocamphane 1,2-monooxygenase 2 [Geodia barretti]